MIEVRFIRTKGLIPKLIRWFTWSKWNHVDICVNNKWYASTRQKGVHRSDLVDQNQLWFEVYPIYNTEEQTEATETFLNSQMNKGYDWLGIFGFIIRKNLENKDKWFCSELVAAALNHAGYKFEDPFKISPAKLYEILVTTNYYHK